MPFLDTKQFSNSRNHVKTKLVITISLISSQTQQGQQFTEGKEVKDRRQKRPVFADSGCV